MDRAFSCNGHGRGGLGGGGYEGRGGRGGCGKEADEDEDSSKYWVRLDIIKRPSPVQQLLSDPGSDNSGRRFWTNRAVTIVYWLAYAGWRWPA
jgi:hypothetical protein